MPNDAPDWQRVVNVAAGPALTDAPDWEHVVVGPGGGAIGGGGGGGLSAATFGFAGWTFPSYDVNAGIAQNNGIIFLQMIFWEVSTSISKVGFIIDTAGGGPVANENYIGIYSFDPLTRPMGDMSLLASTAPGVVDAVVTSLGTVEVSLSAALNVTAGDVALIAYVGQATTAPQFVGKGNYGVYDWPLIGTYTRTITGTYTSLPATILGSNTEVYGGSNFYWAR